MKTKKYGIFVPDEIITKAMNDDLTLFGIEAAKALNVDHFGEILDHTIDHCVIQALGVPINADNINNAASIIMGVRKRLGIIPEDQKLKKIDKRYMVTLVSELETVLEEAKLVLENAPCRFGWVEYKKAFLVEPLQQALRQIIHFTHIQESEKETDAEKAIENLGKGE